MRACVACGWAGLPTREVCPRCTGTRWHEVAQLFGWVRAVTEVSRALGTKVDPPELVALVELDAGGWLVRKGSVAIGARVAVSEDSIVVSAD